MTYFNLKYPWTGCGALANPVEKAHFIDAFQNAPVKFFNVSQLCRVVQGSGSGGTNFLKETVGFTPYVDYLFSGNPFLHKEAAGPSSKYSQLMLTIKPLVYEKNITTIG